MYNMDKNFFLISICITIKHIVSIKQLKSKKLLGASQDGSQEFISLLASICTDSTALTPILIYENKSGNLQNNWLEDYNHSVDTAYFAVSQKGWTNKDLRVLWLLIFEHQTATKADLKWCLLIINNHSSHVNMHFINSCDEYYVILAILPPHSTHQLQPLDLKIFSPLATTYSNEINQIIQSSHGFTRLTKCNFWSTFKPI